MVLKAWFQIQWLLYLKWCFTSIWYVNLMCLNVKVFKLTYFLNKRMFTQVTHAGDYLSRRETCPPLELEFISEWYTGGLSSISNHCFTSLQKLHHWIGCLQLEHLRSHGWSEISQVLSLTHSRLNGRATVVNNRGFCIVMILTGWVLVCQLVHAKCCKNCQRFISSIELISEPE